MLVVDWMCKCLRKGVSQKMTPRCLTGANMCMMVLFINRVSEHRRVQERAGESVEVFMGHPGERGY